MRKGTFGHVQKVKTQTSRRVSDAASDQDLHFFYARYIKGTYISSWVNNWITYSCFHYRVGTDLGLHYMYLLCPKVPFRVTLAINIK